MIRLEIPILLLEYYASGQASFAILQSSYSVAKSFTNETDWYEGTIAGKNRSSVHGLFSAVYGVGFFADGHGQFSVTIGVGNGLSILIPVNFCAEGFTEYTEWNHGSPLSVYIRSSVTLDDVVVDNIIGGTDGHNNSIFSIRIFCTEGVGQGSAIHFTIVSGNNDYYVSGTFFVAVESQFAFAVLHFVVLNFKFNISISVALICNISVEFAINLGEVAFFVNDGYSNFVVFANNTVGWVEGQGFSKVILNNGQFFFNILAVFFIEYLYSDGGTNERVVSRSVFEGVEVEQTIVPMIAIVNDSFAVYTSIEISIVCSYFNTIFINIRWDNFYRLAKSNLIIDYFDGIVAGRIEPVSWACIHVKNDILYGTELSKVEGSSSCLVAALESNLYSVLARDKVLGDTSFVIVGVFQSIHAIGFIPNKAKIVGNQFGAIWLGNAERIGIFVKSLTTYFVAVDVCQFELNSICKVTGSTNIRGIMLGIISCEEIAAVLDSFDIANINGILVYTQGSRSIAVNFADNDIIFTIFVHGEGEFKCTASGGLNSTFFRKALKFNATFSGNREFFVSCRSFGVCISVCITSYSVNLHTTCSNIVVNIDGPNIIFTGINWLTISAVYFIESDFFDFNIGRSYIYRDWFDLVNICNARISYSCAGWNNTSMDGVTITSIIESSLNLRSIHNRTVYFPEVGAWNLSCVRKGCVINNGGAFLNPYIYVRTAANSIQRIVAWRAVVINNIEFHFKCFIFISSCGSGIFIDQELALINVQSRCICNFDSANTSRILNTAPIRAIIPGTYIQIISTCFFEGFFYSVGIVICYGTDPSTCLPICIIGILVAQFRTGNTFKCYFVVGLATFTYPERQLAILIKSCPISISFNTYIYRCFAFFIKYYFIRGNANIGMKRILWSRESSSWNESQHERCHGSQRNNLLRDLIQLYSLPINFTRSFACPHSGAGVAVRPSLASCGTRRPLPPCTSTTASAVAPGTGRIIPAWRYAVAVFPLPIT